MKLTIRDLGLMNTVVFTVRDGDINNTQRYLELRRIPYRKSKINKLCIDSEIGKQIIADGYDYHENDLEEIIDGVRGWRWDVFNIEGKGWDVVDPTLPDIIDDYLEKVDHDNKDNELNLIPEDCSYSFAVMSEDTEVIFKYLKDYNVFYYATTEAYKLSLIKKFSKYYKEFGFKYLTGWDAEEIVNMIRFSDNSKNPIVKVAKMALDYYVKFPNPGRSN